MRVLATSLAAGVISTVLFGCSEDDNESPPKTKYDTDIDYNWNNEAVTKNLAPAAKCVTDSSYADFLTHEYDDDFDKAKANEVVGCMKCLGDALTGLDLSECGDFTSGSVIETCAPFQALKDFVKHEDDGDTNLDLVVTAFDGDCNGKSIQVYTDMTITNKATDVFPCDDFADADSLAIDHDKTAEAVARAFSCLKCIAEEHEPAVSSTGCDWTSTASMVYSHECEAYNKVEEARTATDKAKFNAALAECTAAASGN